MKLKLILKQILFILVTILSINCFSQISFEKGYYIDNNNQKTNCLIKNIDWLNNPVEFEYKISENSKPKILTIKSIKEFGIYNISKYIRSTVRIDRSSDIVSNLSNDKLPIFNEEELFLKVLVEGKSNLYEYNDGGLKRFFYNTENTNIEQLVYKRYNTIDNKVGKNNRFRQQLWTALKCSSFKKSKIENLDYKKNELISFFVEHNKCNNQEHVNYQEKEKIDIQKRDLFNLTLRPRLNSSSLIVQNFVSNSRNIDFGNKIGFGFGIEAEFILPFNKNKWAIAIEPTYQSFKSEKTTNVNGVLIANVNYKSIETPLTLRHYFFINDNSKVFVNASYIFDFSSNSSIEFSRSNGLIVSASDIDTIGNLAMGIGYKQSDKYSFEVRYQTNREVFRNNQIWNSEYKTLSIILGYSLF